MIGFLTIHITTGQSINMERSYLINIIRIFFSKDFKRWTAFKYMAFALLTLILIPFVFLYFKDWFHTLLLEEWISALGSGTVREENINKISELLPYFVVVFSSVVLIGANTFSYYFDFFKSSLTSKEKKAEKHFKWAHFFYFLWFILTISYFIYLFGYFINDVSEILYSVDSLKFLYEHSPYKGEYQFSEWINHHIITEFGNLVHYTEYYILGVITIFIFIDGFYIEALRNKLRQFDVINKLTEAEISAKSADEQETIKEEKAEFIIESRELDFVKNQLWFIDVVVLIGLILTILFSKNGLLQEVDKDAPLVFTVGVLTMHIVYSQLIFLFLNLRRLINEYEDGHS